ncbi:MULTISPECIES: protein kinase domain-containing protein [unclassified Streptomyces]|uniref:serine/threonine-protein kinase n=1 Tax=unclassified Streptomyces TaxID=2593676 RepID=UPI002E7FE69F|nr:PQQ-binding-like beta-propeller repeat protein [Streptomyces sp. NBC_00589]WTI39229.1 serine/threonine-protein kinase [Streptomyces sp. NBC_00775]WUB27092.1 serine/threonine-protein kinase [Streptomyces sp. NBC_00589]
MALRESDPSEVGGYRIEDRLGSGGMGVVYLARSASGRRLAIKVVHGQYADDDEFRTRFSREVAAARQVSGAFTAPVVDADADAPRPWMATLYIPGKNLGTHVRDHGPLPPDRLRGLAAGLAEALRDIHRAGVVHRDLKPANVMLADDGPRVIDFGISRAAEFGVADALTQTGRVMGTPPFMSPEQFSSPHEVGPAADIFSLGAIVAYAATGRGPFDSPSPWETATRVVEGIPELDGMPGELRPFAELCLEKHPKSRPTPDELLTLLRDGTRPGPRPAPDETPGPPTRLDRPRSKRRRRLVIASSVGALLLAVTASAAVVRMTGGGSVRSDLPPGWREWHAAAKASDGAGGAFTSCGATGTSLVCAGDDVKAARFSLATGKHTWFRPVDSTPDDSGSDEGSVLGARAGRVFVYANDETEKTSDNTFTTVAHYSVQSVNATTGQVIWKTRVADGENALAPDLEDGGARVVPEGVVARVGDDARSYALLDADDGKVRWKRPMPKGQTCAVASAAHRAYLVCQPDEMNTTSLSALDPATGKPRWTVTAQGALDLLGQDHGRLILAEATPEASYRAITTVDTTTHRLLRVPLSRTQPADANIHLAHGTLYFTLGNGSVRAVSPRTGHQSWESNSTVEFPGPPLASATHIYIASPSGRLAALDVRTGRVDATRPGRNDAGPTNMADSGAPLLLTGDALYVPYGIRSVYTVDVRHL